MSHIWKSCNQEKSSQQACRLQFDIDDPRIDKIIMPDLNSELFESLIGSIDEIYHAVFEMGLQSIIRLGRKKSTC